MKKLTGKDVRELVALKGAGKTTQEISEHFGISEQTVRNYYRKAKESSSRVCPKCHRGPFPPEYPYCPFCTEDLRSRKERVLDTLRRAIKTLPPPPYDNNTSIINYALSKAISYLEEADNV
ncbi:MAG: hypothetical protein E7590_00050 [Ruminococcaceae bacterium]|nr:hypothetical protein [Oscillospiraceae bacterium]